jgi:hypothetical protein
MFFWAASQEVEELKEKSYFQNGTYRVRKPMVK